MRERARTDGTRESESIETMVLSFFANERGKTWRGRHMRERAGGAMRERGSNSMRRASGGMGCRAAASAIHIVVARRSQH